MLSNSSAARETPRAGDAETLKSKFESFYAARKVKTDRLYFGVVKMGALLSFVGFILCAFFWFSASADSFGTPVALNAATFISGFLGMLGFVVFSSVPTDKLCVDTMLSPLVSGMVRLLMTVLSLAYGSFSKATDAIIVFIVALWVALAMPQIEQDAFRVFLLHHLLRRSPIIVSSNIAPRASALIPDTWMALLSPQFISTAVVLFTSALACQLVQSFFVGAALGGSSQEVPFSPVDIIGSGDAPFGNRVKWAITGTLSAVVMLSPLYFFFSFFARASRTGGAQETPGWRTDILYSFSSVVFIFLAISNIVNDAVDVAYNLPNNLARDIPFSVLFAIAGLWRPLGGARCTFSLIARHMQRRFEFDRKQMRSDGAELASLVTQASTLNWDARCHWVKRKVQAAKPEGVEEGTVDRSFWMVGHLVMKNPHEPQKAPPGSKEKWIPLEAKPEFEEGWIWLKIYFKEDTDTSWAARFEGTALKFQRLLASNAAADFFNGKHADQLRGYLSVPTVASWFATNFGPEVDVVDVDLESSCGGYVVVRVPLRSAIKSSDAIMAASNKTLRKYTPTWNETTEEEKKYYFSSSLLEVSPRDVEDTKKAQIHDMSIKMEFTSSDNIHPIKGIDFFLSHSWDEQNKDAKTKKYEALAAFLARAAPAGSSLWFDKTCLDTLDEDAKSEAIAALPIFTGTADRVIILLSPTYLKRLWCVWELQCVFTFCLRELAVERIVLVSAGGDPNEALAWTLDRAHTFDPNEEYRLRSLVNAIGVERILETVHNLPKCSTFSAATRARRGATPPSGAAQV